MAGRDKKLYPRKLVNYRLMVSQLNQLDEVAHKLGKSKTTIVEEALAVYFNVLKRDGAI